MIVREMLSHFNIVILTVYILLITALTVGFSPAQYTISEAGGAVLLNVNVNQPFEAESVVLQASLVNGTATSKNLGLASIVFNSKFVSFLPI